MCAASLRRSCLLPPRSSHLSSHLQAEPEGRLLCGMGVLSSPCLPPGASGLSQHRLPSHASLQAGAQGEAVVWKQAATAFPAHSTSAVSCM